MNKALAQGFSVQAEVEIQSKKSSHGQNRSCLQWLKYKNVDTAGEKGML